MSMSHDEYIDLSVDNIDDTEDIEFDTYNDEIRINPVLKTHLDDGDKLVWYKDPTIIATWHSNGRLDVPCFDATDVTISAVNFRILKGHWRTKDEHGVGTESNHWLYDDKPISEYLDLYPDFWKANEIKEVQPKKERKPRQKKETSDKTVNVILPRQEDIVKEYKYESEKYLYDSNYSDTYPDTLRKQATPSWVAEDMIDLLPNEVWRTDSKFLDIYCKSGIFLEIIIDRLMKKVNYSSIGLTTDREIRQYIIENQVYAICWNKWYLDLSRKAINGKSSMVGNIYCIGPKIENMTEDEARTILENDSKQSITDKAIQTIDIRKEFFNNVKFDIVIGNPPYNNDIYLDFVEKSFELSSNITCMITPAKWQAKGGEKNEQFRKNIVPHMSKIVYYPVSTDIFDIGESAGISYYITDKSVHTNKELKILCVGQEQFSTDDKYISSDAKALVNSKIRAIIDKCSTMNNVLGNKLNLHQSYYVKNTDSGHDMIHHNDIEVWGGKAGGEKDITGKQFFLLGYKSKDELIRLDGVDKYKACLSCMPTGNNKYGAFDETGMAFGLKEILMLKPNQVPKGSYFPLMCFDTENEVKSFISYFNTRFIRFLIICSIVGTTISTELFRLVPDPGAFDHIFTDEELYKKYNLTDEEINIIESVIKERK